MAYFSLLHLCALPLCAQVELVPNGSFEDYIDCPGGTVWSALMGSNCPGWITPTQGSPDYYHTCATVLGQNTVGNVFGPQPPHSGQAYIGSYMFSYYQPELREYAQVELLQPISAGVRYLVGFYVSRADSVLFSVNTIGAHFSTTPIGSNDVWVLPVEPDIVNEHTDSLIDSNIWYHITDTFVSRIGGGERYLTIGNFNVAAESDTHLVRPPLQITNSYAYYYIDDVSVIALDTLNSVAEAGQGQLQLYPNPAGEKVRIQVSGHRSQQKAICVTDALGRTVLNLEPETMKGVILSGVEGIELDLSSWPSGIYTVSVHLSDGTILHERLVVQHQ